MQAGLVETAVAQLHSCSTARLPGCSAAQLSHLTCSLRQDQAIQSAHAADAAAAAQPYCRCRRCVSLTFNFNRFQHLQADKWKTIEGKPISASLHHAVEAMVGQMNSGIATLPALQNQR